MSADTFPHGFVLSEAAIYSFRIQNVYPDVLSFVVAIPDHLKPLFLIPIQIQPVEDPRIASVADRIVRSRLADGSISDGNSPEADYFGYKTFVTEDNEPSVDSSEEGSIFDIDGIRGRTHHQENNWDENVQVPTDTSYMSDVEPRDVREWPYYTGHDPEFEGPQKQSFVMPVIARLAMKSEDLAPRAPNDVQDRAKSCVVKLVSYDKKARIFTFNVNCGKSIRTVKAGMSDTSQVALACDCPFWRWNGPEFHASSNGFLLGGPAGTATSPDVRDPDRKYWLCKHALAVLKRIDHFVQDVADENWGLEGEPLMKAVDSEWDKLQEEANVPLEELDEGDMEVEIDTPEEEQSEETEEAEQVQQAPEETAKEEEEEEEEEEEKPEPKEEKKKDKDEQEETEKEAEEEQAPESEK